MAEPDTGGPAPIKPPAPRRFPGKPSPTLDQLRREMDRALAPVLAAQRVADTVSAPIRAALVAHEKAVEKLSAQVRDMERQRRAIAASLDSGIGHFITNIVRDGDIDRERREMEGRSPPAADAPPPPATQGAAPPAGMFTGGAAWPAGLMAAAVARTMRELDQSPATTTTTAGQLGRPSGIGDADLNKLVDRIADEVVRRLAAPPVSTPSPATPPRKAESRRGRRRREISVGGVDAALEAMAAEDPAVMALSARAMAGRLGGAFSYTTIQKCPTYKSWRSRLREMRTESKAFGVSGLFEAGVANIGARKPGRRRVKDPTIDPEIEAQTRAFLKAHEGERLDGQ